jgi:anti-sigma regulatory factor (Ser/Thr protein kinase)
MSHHHCPVELRIVSQPRYLCVARAAIGAAVEKLGFDDGSCGQVMLALDEALANVMRHGYKGRTDGPIWVTFEPIDANGKLGFRIVIEDEAQQVDPEVIRGRDLEEVRPGGLGVHIIKKIMDKVEYTRRDAGGMRLVMIKTAPRPVAGAAQEGTAS